MRLINKTRWSSADLEAIIKRVAVDELDPEHFRRLKVTVTYTRGTHNGSSGYAFYNSGLMRVRVSKIRVDLADFAMVVAHEMAHCRGVRHRQMNCRRYKRIAGYRDYYAWATAMPMRATRPLPKPPERPATPRRGTLAAIKADPRVSSVDQDATGYWVYLKSGWTCEGMHLIHEASVREVVGLMTLVEQCDCEDCTDTEIVQAS